MPKRDLNPSQFEAALKRFSFKHAGPPGLYLSTRPADNHQVRYPAFLNRNRTINRRQTISRIISARLRNEAILSAAERTS